MGRLGPGLGGLRFGLSLEPLAKRENGLVRPMDESQQAP
jgi:hypothetical protein